MGYVWRIPVGSEIILSNNTITLPPDYHLEEAGMTNGSMRVYLMNGKREIYSWTITALASIGNIEHKAFRRAADTHTHRTHILPQI